MRLGDILSTAFLNLWRRKLRAFLTVLGMVIGVTSIVVMVSLGIGIKQATIESFASTGSLTVVQVNAWSYQENTNGGGRSQEKELNKRTLKTLEQLPGVTAAMPMITIWGMIKSGRYVTDASILAVTEESAKAFDFRLSDGSFPSGKRGNAYEMVLGAWSMDNFYDPVSYQQAIDRDGNSRIKPNARMQLTFDYSNIYEYENLDDEGNPKPKGAFYNIKTVGTMSNEGNDYAYYCLMHEDSVTRLIKENPDFIGSDAASGKYQQVLLKCASLDDVKPVKTAVEELGYGTYSLLDAVETAQESTARVQYLLGAIGGVALLVAAIGIMNTMMMSIFERTKEIGIIKVLGCSMGNIAALFLCEAAFIGLFGGAMGLGLSYGISFLLNRLLADAGLKSIIPAYLGAGAVAFSIAVALLAGLYPAIRAMRLSPLAAIRNE